MASAQYEALKRSELIDTLAGIEGVTIDEATKLRLKRDKSVDLQLLDLLVQVIESLNSRIV